MGAKAQAQSSMRALPQRKTTHLPPQVDAAHVSPQVVEPENELRPALLLQHGDRGGDELAAHFGGRLCSVGVGSAERVGGSGQGGCCLPLCLSKGTGVVMGWTPTTASTCAAAGCAGGGGRLGGLKGWWEHMRRVGGWVGGWARSRGWARLEMSG